MHHKYPTRFCLIRHGETDWNTERRIQGHLDRPLNARGHAQAREVAKHLAHRHRFDAIYTSDLTRTRQTAEPAANALSLPAQSFSALRERHYGRLQGLTYDEIAARYPDDHLRLKARVPDFTPAGGESLQTLSGRVEDALATLAGRHPGGTILVVSHGGVLDVAHRLASGAALSSPRDFALPNAAFNWLCYAHGEWELEAWADTRHLEGAHDEL
ncbi:histidine phosphatase family protein [Crenobacter cavernae]|uniref:Histidine phosphatase family protein n=1 Tax=Crenobacter cavernae TaxID=2290923 RepID=A0A345Y878_9NEIS|nr:histidine phosphatase family protein [Crenobacter cavernae]AXK40130.1 histidine phosphatase family protein [Crenobacter cavernae]